jgi:hypothetical protein
MRPTSYGTAGVYTVNSPICSGWRLRGSRWARRGRSVMLQSIEQVSGREEFCSSCTQSKDEGYLHLIGSVHGLLELRVLRLSRRRNERLHLVLGSPWKEAIVAQQRGGVHLWLSPPVMAQGDLILTVLDSRPRLLLCLERLHDSWEAGSDFVVDGRADYFDQALLAVPAIQKRLGRPLPGAPATLPEKLADEVLAAVAAEWKAPPLLSVKEGACSPSTSRTRSSGLQAIALGASSGICQCCERDYAGLLNGAGFLGLEVHHLDAFANSKTQIVTTSLKRLAVVCGGCHNILHGPHTPTVASLRYAWRHQ